MYCPWNVFFPPFQIFFLNMKIIFIDSEESPNTYIFGGIVNSPISIGLRDNLSA